MTADEEFRKVAEDVRELARSLRGELYRARWEAKAAARDARRDWREYRRTGQWPTHPGWYHGWAPPPPPPPPPGVAPHGASRVGAPPPPGGAGPAPDAPPAAPPPGAATPPWGAPAGRTAAAPGGGPAGPPGGRTAAPGPGGPGGGPPPHGWHGWFPWRPYAPPPGFGPAPAPPPARPARPPAPPRPKPPPVRHRRDGSTLLSLLLVLVGLAWLGSAAGIVNLSLETVLAAVLVVLGAVMVITARTDWSLSRKAWPVLLGAVVLVLVMASASSGGLGSSFSSLNVGSTVAAPTSASDAGTPVANFAGPIRVDLTSLKTLAPGTTTTLRVHDVFGPINVVLPSNPAYTIKVRAHTAFGPVLLANQGERGGGMFTTKTEQYGGGGGTLDLQLNDSFGPIFVNIAAKPSASG